MPIFRLLTARFSNGLCVVSGYNFLSFTNQLFVLFCFIFVLFLFYFCFIFVFLFHFIFYFFFSAKVDYLEEGEKMKSMSLPSSWGWHTAHSF